MVAVTPTAVVNNALRIIGGRRIDAMETDQTKEAIVARDIYHAARRACLALHSWNGAVKSTSLSALASTTPTFYDSAYQVPDDLIRLLSVHPADDINTSVEYRLETIANDSGTRKDLAILTDVGTTIYIRYVWDQIDMGVLSQGFRDMFAFDLARRFAAAIGKTENKIDLSDKAYRRTLTIAKSIDGAQDYPERLDQGSWYKSRYGLYTDYSILNG